MDIGKQWRPIIDSVQDGIIIVDDKGYFIAANGDILYFNIPSGQVLGGADKEGYHAHFNDIMYFMGGIGRFDGATGQALTNAYVDGDTDGDGPDEFRTFFFSEGTITLVQGKDK